MMLKTDLLYINKYSFNYYLYFWSRFRIFGLDYIEYYSNPEKATKDLIAAIKTHLAQVKEDEERRLEVERQKREAERQREEDAIRKQEEEKTFYWRTTETGR